ncbi:ribosome biogenesis GTPase A [Alteromonas sp. KUL42]|uniref:ribosome biogenesis GTPase YlqF n=1 Tax=Alteromonas sp. KUL42 TaxID=2480797 RepID=UPI0010361D32|nr:ribosome biogenesis GTPase YlqF [Alteromonas sp. KUL42]TAP38347.1 ribosome biogenesis GTPase YlqF [Alteromonas sp. KUL42]GEA05593.1 ribosome biogenesis GTPase A [Alteromonas sp. KUL42]
MALQWFPGHMHKALKEIKESLSQVDILIEVLDARIPYSSENPEIAKIRGDKPCIKILNKYDLADPDITARWQEHLEQERGVKTITTSSDNPGNSKQIMQLIRSICSKKDAQPKAIKAMITGIPNVGKSTLINILAERIIAKTGNEPAVTKSQQRINLGSGIILFDTPGVLWPKLDNPHSIYRLAASGAVKNTAMEYDDVGFFAADYLIKAYPQVMQERYKLETLPDTEIEFLEAAAKNRGAIQAGGRVNLHKICEILLKELQSGKLGRITLETPEMLKVEKEEMAIAEAKKAEAKAKRKQKFKTGSLTPDKKDRKEKREEKRQQQSQRMKKARK